MEWWIFVKRVFYYYCIFAGILIYFIPTYMAFKLRHRRAFAILILNLLAGWTIIGWILAMVWHSEGNGSESSGQKR